MDILPASKSSNWWTVITDNNTITGPNLKDGINGPAFETLQAQLVKAKTVPEQIGLWQAFLKNPANINDAGMPIAKKALNTWMTDGKMPSNVQTVLSKDPFATLPPLAQAQLTYDKTNPASVKNYATALKDTYGNLKKADGTPEFTPAYLDSVAAGTIPQDTFDTRINNIAVKAATADLKAQGISLDDVGGAEGLASSGKLAEYLNDSTKLASAYTSTPTSGSTVVGGPVTTGNGITGLLPKGSYKDANGNFAYTGGQIDSKDMTDFTQSYNPNKGVYRAPTLDASGKLVSNPTSPYSNILNGMLSNYKDPFASGYTSSLDSMQPAAMTSTQLASLSKPFTTNTTASDLVKLANSAGGEYDPTNKAGSTLPPALRQLYQNQTLPDGTVKAKPGVPDPTKMTVPGATITNKSGTLSEPDITDKATADALHKAEQDRIAKEAADKAEADKKALYYNADGTLTGLGFYTYNPTGNYQDYLDKIAAEKAAADTTLTDTGGITSLAEKAAAEKAAADKEQEEATAEWEYNSNKAREETEAWWKAAAEREAAEKAAADKALTEPDTGGIKTLADKAAADKAAAEAERQAGIKVLADKATADKAAADKAIADKAAADKIIADKAAAKKVADAERLAAVNAKLSADAAKLTKAERLAAFEAKLSYADYAESAKNPQPQRLSIQDTPAVTQQGAVGIAGNPNVGSFTSADKAIADKAAADKAIADKAAADKAAADKAIADKASYGPNTVVGSPSGVNAFSAQTVALPPSGPQPINPSNGGPTSAVTVNPSNAGIVGTIDPSTLSVSNMNSNAGGLPSLMGPVAPAVTQQPAVTYTYAPSSQQQLEDKAVNAGYQGDYTDTAAMNSFIAAAMGQ